MNDNPAAGFSLIELVVCVAVLAVLAVGAGLVASRSGSAALQSDSKRFQQHMETARARALQGRQSQGFFVTPTDFSTAVQTHDGWEANTAEMRWRGKAVLQLKEPRLDINLPHLMLLPDGRISAFTLLLTAGGSGQIRCGSDGIAVVSCN